MNASARIRFLFAERENLITVFKALKPEIQKRCATRSSSSLSMENMSLVLEIEAKDTVALRAASNAYLRWIDSLVNVLHVLEKTSGSSNHDKYLV
jgi:tRNA threonylcarbamoyladenosine modification (KEOPS) complex  Pcc1 subunit